MFRLELFEYGLSLDGSSRIVRTDIQVTISLITRMSAKQRVGWADLYINSVSIQLTQCQYSSKREPINPINLASSRSQNERHQSTTRRIATAVDDKAREQGLLQG